MKDNIIEAVDIHIDFRQPDNSKIIMKGKLDASEFKEGLKLEMESTISLKICSESIKGAVLKVLDTFGFTAALEDF